MNNCCSIAIQQIIIPNLSSGIAQIVKATTRAMTQKGNGENNRDLIVCKNTVGSKALMGY